jgi:hypothetical protein
VLFMAEHRSYFALLEMERTDVRMAPVLREGGEVYSRDVARLIREAQEIGSIPDDVDADLASLGVLATVSSFGQYVRSGRLEMPVDDLAHFVGDWVVRALGALTEAPAPS